MKVRIGFGLGTRSITNGERFGPFVDDLENLGFDSLWLSERVGGSAPDPVVAMAYAAGRTRKLKFGTSVMVLPGRNPVLVAKQLASLDRMSNGRLLPAFGLGAVDRHEQQAFGVAREDRAAWFNEALPLIRRLWAEESITHHGERFTLDDIGVSPKPIQIPMDVWLGGIAPSELRRVGRLADGWLPSFVTPADVAAAQPIIEQAAAEAGRTMDPEHWGVLIGYGTDGSTTVSKELAAFIAKRRPDLDPSDVIPPTLDTLAEQIEAFVAVGFSKIVVIPMAEPNNWSEHLHEIAARLLPLQKSLSS